MSLDLKRSFLLALRTPILTSAAATSRLMVTASSRAISERIDCLSGRDYA